MSEARWYRVTDPLSPLCGCDVRGREHLDYFLIDAVRRIDIFVGDRPFQRVAPTGQDLGLMIRSIQLIESPLQDDIVELATDTPYGKFVWENEFTRPDGASLHVVEFERKRQIALRFRGHVLKSVTSSVHGHHGANDTKNESHFDVSDIIDGFNDVVISLEDVQLMMEGFGA